MTTTAGDLISDALQSINQYASAETIDSADSALALRELNRMMDAWAGETLMVPSLALESFTLSAGTASYTTAALTSGRPVDVLDCYVQMDIVSYPVRVIKSPAEFDAIPVKTIQSIPDRVFYDNAFPTATFTFFPVPNAAFTAYIRTYRTIQTFAATSTAVSLPPGYEDAIVRNLALRLCPFFAQPVTADVVDAARQSKAVLKRQNYRPGVLRTMFDRDPDYSNNPIYKGF